MGGGAKGRAGGGGAHSLRQREFLQLHCRLGCGFAGLFVGLAIIPKRNVGSARSLLGSGCSPLTSHKESERNQHAAGAGGPRALGGGRC